MEDIRYSRMQALGLVTLRVLTGWLFLYEGLVKIVNPDWTSAGFLLESAGPFSGFFRSLASDPDILRAVDFMNEWGLTLIGLGLIAGCLTRAALVAGMVLLGFYYLSHPPFTGLRYAAPTEGSYLWVNKNLVQLAAMFVLYHFNAGRIFGMDTIILRKKLHK